MEVSEAIRSRISCRAFLPDPVPEAMVRELLNLARNAPSGGNIQPWHILAITGGALNALLEDIQAKMAVTPRGEPPEYRVYPQKLEDPYRARRFKCGEDLYATINISRNDKQGRLAQFKNNFKLFGAPVGLFVFIDRVMGPPQWADVGMFLQTLMLQAREMGLHSCAQESWIQWHETIARHLDPPADLMLFCTVALGYMDISASINTLRTERASVDEFTRFIGFDESL